MIIVEGVTGAVGCAKGALETWELLYGQQSNENLQKMKNESIEENDG